MKFKNTIVNSNKPLKIFLLMMLTFAVLNTWGQQKELIAFNTKKQKEKVFKENKKIKVYTINNMIYKGKYEVIDNQTIKIKKQAIQLNEIEKIYSLNLAREITKKGSTIIAFGAFMITPYTLYLSELNPQAALIPLGISAGAAITTGVLYIAEPTHKAKRWEYYIREIVEEE